MTVKSLSVLVLVVLALAGGWWLYRNDYIDPALFSRFQHHGPSVAVNSDLSIRSHRRDETTFPMDLPPGKTTLFTPTRVPANAPYLSVEFLASHAEHPFPKIFISDRTFPTDQGLMDTVMVVRPSRLPQVMASQDDLDCATDSGNLEAGSDRVEVMTRTTTASFKRCLIGRKQACHYLRRLGRIPAADLVGDNAVAEDGLNTLQRSMQCPAKPALF
jgi:hypothetical protein